MAILPQWDSWFSQNLYFYNMKCSKIMARVGVAAVFVAVIAAWPRRRFVTTVLNIIAFVFRGLSLGAICDNSSTDSDIWYHFVSTVLQILIFGDVRS